MSGHVRGVTAYRNVLVWLVVPALVVLQFVLPLVLNTVPKARATTAPAQPVAVSWKLQVRSQRTEALWPGNPNGGIKAKDPVAAYHWLITADDSGNPADAVTTCTPTDGKGNLLDPSGGGTDYSPGVGNLNDPNVDQSTYCQWPSVRYTPGALAVVAEGDQGSALPTSLVPGKYLVSVTADNFKIDGAHFTVDAGGSVVMANSPSGTAVDTVVVGMQPYPLQTGTLRLRVFKDTAPVDGTYEVGVEQGLGGFTVHLSDVLAEVTTDFFGNRLCTNYQHQNPADPNSPIVTVNGVPQIDLTNPGGRCVSDASGDVAIPNLGPDRYTANVIPPAGQKWYQTTTLEGNHDWDMWIAEADSGFDSEQTVGGEPVPPVDMGFVPDGHNADGTPRSVTVTGAAVSARVGTGAASYRTVDLTLDWGTAPTETFPVGSTVTLSGFRNAHGVSFDGPATVTSAVDSSHLTVKVNGGNGFGPFTATGPARTLLTPDAGPGALTGAGEVKGTVVEINTYVGGTGGVTVPNAGVAGANVRGPVSQPIITLSDLNNNDQMVYVGRGGTNGSFDIPKVPAGTYQLTAWDYNQDLILDSFNVTVGTDTSKPTDVGQKGLVDWYTDIKGTVFIDTNGNGKRDCTDPAVPSTCEPGVAKFPVVLKERDNSLMDAGQNTTTTDDNGNYDLREGYPISRWTVLEAFNTRYKTTGITVQADNEPTPTTYTGAAVDVSVLPVIGLSGRVDWGVQPYSGKENGGIVGTVTYDTTRNELDPMYAVTEAYQPGIPGLTMHLYAPIPCTVGGTAPSYAGTSPVCQSDGYWHYADDGTTQPELTAKGAPGAIVPLSDDSGNPIDLYNTYTTETWQQPTGCTARLHNGKPLDYNYQSALPPAGDNSDLCVEAPMLGWQAKPSDTSPGNFSQTVNGNYGFGQIDHDPSTGSGTSVQPIPRGDYIVKVDIPKLPNGQPLYQVTKEQDVNVFDGDVRTPQEGAVDSASGAPVDITQTVGNAPASQGAGIWSPCVGASQTVTVTDPAYLAGGGSPYEGTRRPLCDEKLVSVRGGQSVAPNFNLFTPVPLPTHFWGLTINDLGLSQDKTQAGYGEAQPLPHVPMGIYDYSGRLLDTVLTDYNGMYEATEPSTSSYNCPLPAGPCPGMYYFKGNDPGQPGHVNKDYNPRFRTIGTNFQAWPGLFTPTDTAPTQVAAVSVAPGSTQINTVDCSVNAGLTDPTTGAVTDPTKATPDIFQVSPPFMRASSGNRSQSVTIRGSGFGASQGTVQLARTSGTSNVQVTVSQWSDNRIDLTVSGAAGAVPTAGTYQLTVTNASGPKPLTSVNGLTFHILGSGYNPTLYQVNPPPAFASQTPPGNTFRRLLPADANTSPETVLQDALDAARRHGGSTLVIAWPDIRYDTGGQPIAEANNPTNDYFENLVLSHNTQIQGVGPGGFADAKTWVDGTRLNGIGFNPDNQQGANWVTTVSSLADVTTVPDGADVTVLGNSSFGASFPAMVDGFTITGGDVADFPSVLSATQTLYGGNTTPAGSTNALISQGGGIYLHGNADNTVISNNVIVGNNGAYGGAVRIGTPYTPQSSSNTLASANVKILHNRIRDNGGMNLAGGIGIFNGSSGYVIDHNDVCGNFSAEYGGGISQYGLSGGGGSGNGSAGGSITNNRIYFNQSYDEAGGVMIAGELSSNLGRPSTGSGPVTIDANLIADNLANDDGGGVRFLSAGTWSSDLTNNMIVDNISTHEGGGIALDDTAGVGPTSGQSAASYAGSAHRGLAVVGNTIAKNITTATAVTSTGQPAPTGLSTANVSVQLLNTLNGSAAAYSRPDFFSDNIFWDNRAGTWNGSTVTGIGATGPDLWDLGSGDTPLLTKGGAADPMAPTFSIIQSPNHAPGGQVASAGSNSAADPLFATPYDVGVQILASRTFPSFREAVIVANPVAPQLQGDYHLQGASPAGNAGRLGGTGGPVLPPSAVTLMHHDFDEQSRAAGTSAATPIDLGADEIH